MGIYAVYDLNITLFILRGFRWKIKDAYAGLFVLIIVIPFKNRTVLRMKPFFQNQAARIFEYAYV
jgi:hypothetical protein